MKLYTSKESIFKAFLLLKKLATNMKQISNKLTSKYVISMFQLLEDMVQMKPFFLQAFEESMQYTKIKQNTSNSIEHFLGIFMIIERAVSNIYSILNDTFFFFNYFINL